MPLNKETKSNQNHSWEDKEVQTFLKSISLKMNVIV